MSNLAFWFSQTIRIESNVQEKICPLPALKPIVRFSIWNEEKRNGFFFGFCWKWKIVRDRNFADVFVFDLEKIFGRAFEQNFSVFSAKIFQWKFFYLSFGAANDHLDVFARFSLRKIRGFYRNFVFRKIFRRFEIEKKIFFAEIFRRKKNFFLTQSFDSDRFDEEFRRFAQRFETDSNSFDLEKSKREKFFVSLRFVTICSLFRRCCSKTNFSTLNFGSTTNFSSREKLCSSSFGRRKSERKSANQSFLLVRFQLSVQR